MEYEDQYDYEREIEFEIAGERMTAPVTISDVVIDVEMWNESGNVKDYDTRWTSAKVEIRDGYTRHPLWTGTVKPENLNVTKVLSDATLSDILDEIAEEAFLRDWRAGEFG